MMNSYFTSTDVKLLERKCLYQGHFQLNCLKLQYRLFDGNWSRAFYREIFERGDSVGVLLFDPHRNAIVLIEQFRVGTVLKTENSWLLEIVAGVINPLESPIQVAERETQEETGLILQNLFPIYQYWVSPGGSTEQITLFCAKVDSSEAKGIHGLASEGENIRLHVVNLQDAYNLVNAGKIDNATTIISLLWLQQNEQNVRQFFAK
jgi:ADP-ribose pyrophosphatase